MVSNVRAMTTESTGSPAQQIAAGYATQGSVLELGTVVVDGTCDPAAQVRIPLATVNRHGLVAGATGTGKTKSLQVIGEQLSAAGVPVVMADIKGDLAGLSLDDVAHFLSPCFGWASSWTSQLDFSVGWLLSREEAPRDS